MAAQDNKQLTSFSSKDEKEAQEELDRLRKRLREHERGAFKTPPKWIGFQGKTLWDWLQLVGILAIPLVVAGATILLGIQQAQLAKDQQLEATLVAYEKDISDLLLIHHLGSSKEDVGSRGVANARTLSTLQVLDPIRKGLLLYFLDDTGLISARRPIVSLVNADLSGAYLVAVGMPGAYLHGADLHGADLSCYTVNYCADLHGADLSGADLSGADLSGADLHGARYNTKTIQETDEQGNTLPLEPTQWPQGFDPKAAGATCVDC